MIKRIPTIDKGRKGSSRMGPELETQTAIQITLKIFRTHISIFCQYMQRLGKNFPTRKERLFEIKVAH